MSPLQENLFCFSNSVFNSNFRILWEIFIPDNKLMKLISKIISTSSSTMAIIDREEGAPWPFFDLFKLWFNDIQNDWNSIFIVISDNSLMGIGWITTDNTILFAGELCWMIWGDISIDLVLFHFHVLLLLLHGHNETSIGYQLIMTFRLL